MTTEVLIIGAGPTGLMAAALLARCGIKIRIIDKTIHQAHESRALGIQAKTLELFQNMGIVDKIIERGMITKGLRLYINGNKEGEIVFENMTKHSPYSFIIMLSQAETEKILNEDLTEKNILVERGISAKSIIQSNDNIQVSVEHDGQIEVIECAYVIGADGAHSVVREQVGLSFDGAAYSQQFALGDAKVDWPLDHDRLCVFLHGKSFGAFFPLHDKEAGRVLAITHDTNKYNPTKMGSEPMTLLELQSAFSKVVDLPVRLSNPTWLARFYIHHRGVDQYRKGRAFVAGDAAHIHSPIGAQGMNTGLQDVANLCWKLAMVIQGKSAENILETYHAERWPIGQKLLNFTDRLFSLIATQNSLLIILRDLFLRTIATLALRVSLVRQRMFHFVTQLGIRYHVNKFIQGQQIGNLKPGYRAPNAKITNDTEVFDLICGYRFHLLIISKTVIAENEQTDFKTLPDWIQLHWITVENVRKDEIFSTYGINDPITRGIFLIRPDGHIAFQTSSLDIQSLLNFLKSFQD